MITQRGLFIAVHIADIHFAAFDPKRQYTILKEQFLDDIIKLPRIDLISIDGDLFDHKLMGNSDGLYYATKFIADVVTISKRYHATVLILHGTYSHDADQLKNFYHYMNRSDVDVRVVTNIKFESIKGTRVLCIPELYGVDESIYQHYLHYSGYYDEAFMHGTFEGAVYGNNVGNGRLFTRQDFDMCTGFMIGGHVHKPGCHGGYFYYTGCPYRWRFGEEENKGFLITVHDLDTNLHYIHFKEIKSDSYVTIDLDTIQYTDPKKLIEYINSLHAQDIDYLKVRINYPIVGTDRTIINNYYRNNPITFIEFMNIQEQRKREQESQSGIVEDNMSFLLNDKLSDFEKFVQFVNLNEGSTFITVEKLKEILEEQI